MLPYKRHIKPLYSLINDEYDWYYDDCYDSYPYYDDCYNGAIFEYVPEDKGNEESHMEVYVGSRYRRLVRHKPTLRIDMMSIYSKEMMRQKKIDIILEGEKDTSNTIKNIINAKKL